MKKLTLGTLYLSHSIKECSVNWKIFCLSDNVSHEMLYCQSHGKVDKSLIGTSIQDWLDNLKGFINEVAL